MKAGYKRDQLSDRRTLRPRLSEEAITKIKRFLLVARHTHTSEAYAALSAPILRELQDRARDVLVYLSQAPGVAR
jgi:hypothetical protein